MLGRQPRQGITRILLRYHLAQVDRLFDVLRAVHSPNVCIVALNTSPLHPQGFLQQFRANP